MPEWINTRKPIEMDDAFERIIRRLLLECPSSAKEPRSLNDLSKEPLTKEEEDLLLFQEKVNCLVSHRGKSFIENNVVDKDKGTLTRKIKQLLQTAGSDLSNVRYIFRVKKSSEKKSGKKKNNAAAEQKKTKRSSLDHLLKPEEKCVDFFSEYIPLLEEKTVAEEKPEYMLFLVSGGTSRCDHLYKVLRNALAHGHYEIRQEQDEKVWYLENGTGDSATARIRLKESTLLKMIDLLDEALYLGSHPEDVERRKAEEEKRKEEERRKKEERNMSAKSRKKKTPTVDAVSDVKAP